MTQEPKRILELYSGTAAISRTFAAHGWEALTIDNNPLMNPGLCLDMLDFDISMLDKSWRPDVIWASPPCTTFSVCTISKHWKNGRPVSSRAFVGLALVFKAIEIIQELKPKYFFIENPRGMLRSQPFMAQFPRHTATYCQYGMDYQKPTDIWTNADLQLKSCSSGDSCHQFQPRNYIPKSTFNRLGQGVQGLSGAEERGAIPPRLCEEIYKSCLREPIDKNKLSGWNQ